MSLKILDGNWLYAQYAPQFIEDASNPDVFADFLESRFRQIFPDDDLKGGEIRSWREAFPVLSNVLTRCNFASDHQLVILEYFIPSSKPHPNRADAMICGVDMDDKLNAVMVELKRWKDIEIKAAGEPGLVLVKYKNQRFKGGKNEADWVDHKHPCYQAYLYETMMGGAMQSCGIDPAFISLKSCAFLPKLYESKQDKEIIDFLRNELDTYQRQKLVKDTELFIGDQIDELCSLLEQRIGKGGGEQALDAFRRVQKIANATDTFKKKIRKRFQVKSLRSS